MEKRKKPMQTAGSPSDGTQVVLTMTMDQARMVDTACELYARLKIGQFEIITEQMLNVGDVEEYCKRRDIANDLLHSVACVIYGRNINGMPHAQKDAMHHRAWNIHQAIRYCIAWHEHPEGGWGVCFDRPYPDGGEPVPEARIKNIRAEEEKR